MAFRPITDVEIIEERPRERPHGFRPIEDVETSTPADVSRETSPREAFLPTLARLAREVVTRLPPLNLAREAAELEEGAFRDRARARFGVMADTAPRVELEAAMAQPAPRGSPGAVIGPPSPTFEPSGRSSVAAELPRDVVRSFAAQGAGMTRAAAETLAELGMESARPLAERAAEAGRGYERERAVSRARLPQAVRSVTPERLTQAGEAIAEPANLLEAISQTIQLAPGLGASAVTRSAVPALTTMRTTTAGPEYHRYREQGLTPARAAVGAVLQAEAEAQPEKLALRYILTKPIGRLLAGSASEFGTAVRYLLNTAGLEATSEAISTTGNWLTDAALRDPTATLPRLGEDLKQMAAQMAVQAPAMAGVARAGRAVPELVARAAEAVREQPVTPPPAPRRIERAPETRIIETRDRAEHPRNAPQLPVERQDRQYTAPLDAARPADRGGGGPQQGAQPTVVGQRLEPRDVATLPAIAINRELDRLEAEDSRLNQEMIDTGRGEERPSEYLRKTDPLSERRRANYDRRTELRDEIARRWGPSPPSRLPPGRGFNPRREPTMLGQRGGKRVRVFHGTAREGRSTGRPFQRFDRSLLGSVQDTSDAKAGFWFTDDKRRARTAASDAKDASDRTDTSADVFAIDLNLRNPLVIKSIRGLFPQDVAKIADQAKAEGHDSIIFTQGEGRGSDYLVFDPDRNRPGKLVGQRGGMEGRTDYYDAFQKATGKYPWQMPYEQFFKATISKLKNAMPGRDTPFYDRLIREEWTRAREREPVMVGQAEKGKFRPALKLADGEVIEARANESTHAQMLFRLIYAERGGQSGAFEEAKFADAGFVDDQGKFLTREEAGERVGYGATSERLGERGLVGQRERVKVARSLIPLDAEQERVEEKVIAYTEEHFEELVERYLTGNMPDGEPFAGRDHNLINADNARLLFPWYAESKRSRGRFSAAVHESASVIVKEAYRRLLAKAPVKGYVAFTAGGTGAGKSTGLKKVGELQTLTTEADVLYDTNMNNFESARKKIDQAIDSGRQVFVLLMWRDALESLKAGVIPRAVRDGRTVPVEYHIDTHQGAIPTIRRLVEHYKDNDDVAFLGIENITGEQEAARWGSVVELFAKEHTLTLEEAKDVIQTLEQNGEITRELARNLLGRHYREEPEARRRGEAQRRRAGEVGQEPGQPGEQPTAVGQRGEVIHKPVAVAGGKFGVERVRDGRSLGRVEGKEFSTRAEAQAEADYLDRRMGPPSRQGFTIEDLERQQRPVLVGQRFEGETQPPLTAPVPFSTDSHVSEIRGGTGLFRPATKGEQQAITDALRWLVIKHNMPAWMPTVIKGGYAIYLEGDYGAVYIAENDIIGLRTKNIHRVSAATDNLAHELGHAIDRFRSWEMDAAGDFASAYSERLKIEKRARTWHFKGDLAKEADDASMNNPEVGSYLLYPFADLLAGTMSPELTGVELFAQIGSLYFRHPELVRRTMPKWFKVMEAIYDTEQPPRGRAEAHARLREALQIKGALPGDEGRREGRGQRVGAGEPAAEGTAEGRARPGLGEGTRQGEEPAPGELRGQGGAGGARARAGGAAPRVVGQAEPRLRQKYAGNTNLERLSRVPFGEVTFSDIVDLYNRSVNLSETRTPRSHEQTQAAADELGLTLADLLERQPGEAFNAEQAKAARDVLIKLAADVKTAGTSAATGNAEAIADFAMMMHLLTAAHGKVAGIAAEAGRALNSYLILARAAEHNIFGRPEAWPPPKSRSEAVQQQLAQTQAQPLTAQLAIEQLGGFEQAVKTAREVAAGKNPLAIIRKARTTSKKVAQPWWVEFWKAILLTNPATHVVNFVGTGLTTAFRPVESLAAAALSLGAREKVYFREAIAMTLGALAGVKPAVRAALQTIRTGNQPYEKYDHQIAITGRTGEVVRVPFRLMATGDAFWKAINYTMSLYQLAARDTIREGRGYEGFNESIMAPSEATREQAEADMDRYTYNAELGEKGKAFQNLVRRIPVLNLVFPYIRTPANIFKFAAERSVFAPIIKEWRADFKAGGSKRREAIARLTVGSAMSATAFLWAAGGAITGGGPPDPERRRRLLEAGWQPYSFRIGDKYYSYRRLEPLGMLLGMAADMYEVYHALDEGETEKLGKMLAYAFANNITSKTFLQGWSDAARALDPGNPEQFRWAESLTSALATPPGVAGLARQIDPYVRETKGVYGDSKNPFVKEFGTILARIQSRTPWWSKSLPLKRDIYGEPIERESASFVNPIAVSTPKRDETRAEMAKIGARVAPLPRVVGGHRLTAEEYEEYQQAAGERVRARLESFFAAGRHEALALDEQREAVSDIARQARREARRGLPFARTAEEEEAFQMKRRGRAAAR